MINALISIHFSQLLFKNEVLFCFSLIPTTYAADCNTLIYVKNQTGKRSEWGFFEMIVLIRAGKQYLHSDATLLPRTNNLKFIWNWELLGAWAGIILQTFFFPNMNKMRNSVFADTQSNKINPHNLEINVDKTTLTMTNPVKLVMKAQCITENWGCGKFLDE